MIAGMTMAKGNSNQFSTTHWSLLAQAADKADPMSKTALETLCRRYWFPLYAFVRREGHNEHDAQDLTQAFFASLLGKEELRDVDPKRGKFRSFLLAALRHFLSNARDFAKAAKRGGGKTLLSFDFNRAETCYADESATHLTPEKLFHRRWALELLRTVLQRLRDEWATPDKREFFAAVEDWITGAEPSRTYAEVAAAQDMTEGAVKTAVHRLRRRYRDLLREEIGHTVADPGAVDDEIRELFAALQGT
jgi:RNA polymerase sigma-70 factor (ECF subfamily)